MDDHDRRLLIELQKEIPLVPRPFEEIGRRLGLDSAEVILRVDRLRNSLQMERVAAFLDAGKIGYQTVVLAMSVPESWADETAAVFAAHPGICQCAWFKHTMNLWCLLALPEEEPLESHLLRLQENTKPRQMVVLRTLKSFKPAVVETSKEARPLTEEERKVLRALQQDFPLTDEPFRKMGNEENILRTLQVLKERGVLKKISAVFPKGKTSEGTLVIWQAPEEKIGELAWKLAEERRVRSCVQRTSSAEIPYALHTVVDGKPEEVSVWIKQLEPKIGRWPYEVLAKEKDYKKTKLIYFPQELENWRVSEDPQLLS